jgi:hypothetical protein
MKPFRAKMCAAATSRPRGGGTRLQTRNGALEARETLQLHTEKPLSFPYNLGQQDETVRGR